MLQKVLVALIVAETLAAVALAGDPAADATSADDAQIVFFEKEVRPLLASRCYECHGSKQQWSGLRLDTRDGLLNGGETGALFVAGRPEESLLIRAIRREADVSAMPPEDAGDPLDEREIGVLTRWIATGAVIPSKTGLLAEDRSSHWAFQPVTRPAVPDVNDAAWPCSSLDRFILLKLETEGLAPAGPADRQMLLRRVTFDLTGLPPTPEDVESFLRDKRADAYERLVDRLLASPAYGERWGRHWLDVARYADSNGLDENVAHGNAWRYRDYVVAAFNSDKPYDRFLTEQIAGDLLATSDAAAHRENLIATGFLALGPKVLAEVDAQKMEMDIVDEQLDTVGRVFLGMTFGCARCHDHKFDPISTADYYALAGIFKSTRTMETFAKVARWHENVLPSDETRTRLEAHEQQKAKAQLALSMFVERADAQLTASGIAVPSTPTEREALYPAESKATLEKLRKDLIEIEKSPPELPSAMGVSEGTVEDVAVHLRGSHLKLGDVVPRRMPEVFTTLPAPAFPANQSGRGELAKWLTHDDHPLTGRVIVNRIWRWHFGDGITRTPDNFGLLGEQPTHPELLDWLARRFVEEGGSIKWLHRTILLSSTYRQSDRPSPRSAELDPDNRLLSRMPLRRLDAEEVRDALLAVSRRLDRTMGGSLLAMKNRDYFFDHTSKDATTYMTLRRAVYLPVVRNHVYDVLGLLDFPDPAVSSGDRSVTTTAPQALLMMNSEFVADAAAALAERLAEPGSDDASRVRRLYRIAFGRDATSDEVAAGLEFLSRIDEVRDPSEAVASNAWTALCQVMLSANE
nr:PSD1 and planctomycete cytochrome C domain-containing protein [Planctomycetota bacterium]